MVRCTNTGGVVSRIRCTSGCILSRVQPVCRFNEPIEGHPSIFARSTAPPGYLLPSTVYLHVHNPLLYLRTQYRLSKDERYKSVGSSYAPISFCDKFFTFYPKLVLIEINAALRSREGHASAPIIEAVVSINFPLVSRLTNRNFYFRLRG